ncbi:MAG: EAL domain-containing protein [Methylohalobius sp.]|nr:EAL domain-containing protein [Methylohalobius sp.]
MSLRLQALFHLSLLIAALTLSFGVLNYFYLHRQFDRELDAHFASIEQEMHGLLERSADRLQRLGSVAAMLVDLSQPLLLKPSEPLPPSLIRLSTLHYELDLQSLGLFDAQRRLVWQWPPERTAADLADSQIRSLLEGVYADETPKVLLTCAEECALRALVPALAEGKNVGAIEVAQSIADLILDFRAVTGTNTEIGIVLKAPDSSPRPARIVALTNRKTLSAFLEYLASRYFELEPLSEELITWQHATYAIHPIPLNRLIEAPEGKILLISDVTETVQHIRQTTLGVLLKILALAAAGELILLLLIRAPTRRLERLATTLPLLAQGRYSEARNLLGRARSKIELYDEIDVLDETAVRLSIQLENQARALAIRNRELADERDFIRGLLNAAQVIILTQTKEGLIRTVNDHGLSLTGFSYAELSGQPFTFLLHHPSAAQDFYQWLKKPVGEGEVRFQHELEIRCCDGTLRDIVWVHTRLKESHSSQTAVLSVGLDVTDRVRAEARLAWLANHDPLTGLYNRHRFQEELERTLAEVQRAQRICALILFDLDHFKDINDSSGHAAGDALLKLLAEILQERTRRSDVVARLGGDEFAVLMADTKAEGAEAFARGLNDRLIETPFTYAGRTYRVSASIGIVLIPHHGDNLQDLLANADLAMYQAKQSGRGRYHLFSFQDQAREGVGRRVYWKEVLTRALAEKRLRFYFQPIAETRGQAIVYHEALLRLEQEDGSLVLPGAFIDAAQRSGLMPAIDRFVVEEALKILPTGTYPNRPLLAINLSAYALTDTHWIHPLKDRLRSNSLNPKHLLLEVTETAAITDLNAARQIMDELTEFGFQFAIDDFGAGFSSFHYLKHLPIAYVKIDQSFVSKLAKDPRDRAFVQAIVTLAHGYGQKVVAEGVEDQATLETLRELEVDYVQGFHIGRPSRHMAINALSSVPTSVRLD